MISFPSRYPLLLHEALFHHFILGGHFLHVFTYVPCLMSWIMAMTVLFVMSQGAGLRCKSSMHRSFHVLTSIASIATMCLHLSSLKDILMSLLKSQLMKLISALLALYNAKHFSIHV